MKRYTYRATKLLAIAALICGAVVLIGIILAFAGIENIELPIVNSTNKSLIGYIRRYNNEKNVNDQTKRL